MPVFKPHRFAAQRVAASLFCCLTLAIGSTAHAGDEELERDQLARITHEIAQLEALVAAAAQNKPTGQRVQFRYEWLQRDLQLVREGITQHTDAPRQPRPVPPLRGDYRQ